MTYVNSENIVLAKLNTLILPNQSIITEENLVSLQLNLTPIGGSFSLSILRDTAILPPENFLLQFPFGKIGVVKTVNRARNTGGFLDTVTGPLLPLNLTLVNFVGFPGNVAQLASIIASNLAKANVFWFAFNPNVKGFTFRGISLQGVQQLAGEILGEVYIYKNIIYVMTPGQSVPVASTFNVLNGDVVSLTQTVDYSQDIAAVLNPVLTAINFDNPGDFIYDSEHAQKQAQTIVQAGAPSATGSKDFIPIPDGWMVDGNFEEWAIDPTSGDTSNPNASVNRYWKTFPSPVRTGFMRGITNFTRLVKDLKLPGNVSSFVGSPITAATQGNSDQLTTFTIQEANTQNGIFGFTADTTFISDIVSGQYIEPKTAIQLIVPGGSSGEADSNFFTIQLEFWTFPRVTPTTFPVGDPTNPFGLPPNVVIVNPSSNVTDGPVYWNSYLSNYRLINSPRLKTQVSVVFRGQMPQPGDKLVVVPADQPVCGRINSVALAYQRGGLVLNISAEVYQYGPGLWNSALGGGTIFQ